MEPWSDDFSLRILVLRENSLTIDSEVIVGRVLVAKPEPLF